MTTLEALKDLYVALGGKAEDVAGMTTKADVISAMVDVVTNK